MNAGQVSMHQICGRTAYRKYDCIFLPVLSAICLYLFVLNDAECGKPFILMISTGVSFTTGYVYIRVGVILSLSERRLSA